MHQIIDFKTNPFESIALAFWNLAGADNHNSPYITFLREREPGEEADGNATPDVQVSNLVVHGPNDPAAESHFFGSLIAQYGSMITQESTILDDQKYKHWDEIEDLFNDYGVDRSSPTYEYACLLYSYILSKKGLKAAHRVTNRLTGDLLHAVTFSKHRTFSLME